MIAIIGMYVRVCHKYIFVKTTKQQNINIIKYYFSWKSNFKTEILNSTTLKLWNVFLWIEKKLIIP